VAALYLEIFDELLYLPELGREVGGRLRTAVDYLVLLFAL